MLLAALLLAFGLAVCTWVFIPTGVLGIVLLLPAYVARFTVFGLPTTALEFGILGALAGAVLHWSMRRSAFPRLPRRAWVSMAAWLVIGLFGVAVAADHYHALGLFRAYVLEPLLLVPLGVALVREEQWRVRLLDVMSVLLLTSGTVAMLQRLHVVASAQPWIAEHPPRVVSLFEYPNAAALFVAPLALLLLGAALLLRTYSRAQRTLWIISGLSGILVAGLAYSRGALLGIGIGLVVLGAWSRRRWLWWACCAAVIAVLLVVPATRARITDAVLLRDTSTDVRHVLWEGTWRLIRARPLVGAGLGGFPAVYNHYRLPQHVELLEYPHNILFNAWVAFGLPGALALIAGVSWLSYALFRRLRQHDLWAVPTLVAWVVLVVHGLVDVPYFKNDLAILTLLLVLLAVQKTDTKIPPA